MAFINKLMLANGWKKETGRQMLKKNLTNKQKNFSFQSIRNRKIRISFHSRQFGKNRK